MKTTKNTAIELLRIIFDEIELSEITSNLYEAVINYRKKGYKHITEKASEYAELFYEARFGKEGQ